MEIFDRLLGKHLSNAEEHQQKVGPLAGVPMLGLDGLSSSAYGPEAAATVLLPLGVLGATYVVPITIAIVLLLAIVFLSYRQTIAAYPNGGGSYTVAKENLGTFAGLVAAAALILDYVLVVAVGISAGVGSLVSALPSLQPHVLSLCLITLVVITLINLRGVKESGLAFMLPTYLFVLCLFGVIAVGCFKFILTGGHPVPVAVLPKPALNPDSIGYGGVSIWLLARAFASGCTAMTGVEAVSNGTKVFREPLVKNARVTLLIIVGILVILLLGIAYLGRAYGIVATAPGEAGYESIISQLIAAVVGRGILYYLCLGSVILVLMLSANTGFADFPRTCQIVARDNFLPHTFAERGRRLVFSHGIIVLAALSGILLIFFDGITDNLIPLFAIGAFLAFTLSQAGMVMHWKKCSEKGSGAALLVNAAGATATAATLLVILVSKFTEGGWITVFLIPLLLMIFYGTYRHYRSVAKQVNCRDPLEFGNMNPPIVLVPVRGWSRLTRKAVHFAMLLTPDVYGVHVETENGSISLWLEEQWKQFVVEPSYKAGKKPPLLVQLPNPYRRLFGSLIDFIEQLKMENPGRRIAVVIPDLVENKWYHYFLHNQRAVLLRTVLTLKADPRIVVITVPWYLDT
ncbi:MAG: APC family permease [Bdellovibrionota bacterium]